MSLEYEESAVQTSDHGTHPPCPASAVIMIGEENGSSIVQASNVRSTWQRIAICRIGHTSQEVVLAGCGKTILAQQNFDGLHVWDKPGLSGESHATKQTRQTEQTK